MERIVAIGEAAGGFFEFRRQLDDKARLYGASVVVADRWFPSSKTCSCCGSVKAELDVSQRVFRCGPCGLVADRDCNACEKSCTTGRKLCGVSLWRGTLWRGSQEPRETRLKDAGTERRRSALRSLAYSRVGFGERYSDLHGRSK
jgi:Putative transposase DNA-binding domain